MDKAVLFDLYGTLVHLPLDRFPYMQLCRKVGCRKRLRESMTVESPTLIDFVPTWTLSLPMTSQAYSWN